MPVKPQFQFEQTTEHVFVHITLKGCRKNTVDVFVSDVFAKVNAPPSYLLTLDLLHPVDAAKSTHYFDAADPTVLHVKLHKLEEGLVWGALCAALGKKELMARRAASMQAAEKAYNGKLEARVAQHETEKRRMTEEQWKVENQQRQLIEHRFQAEKTSAEEDLYGWEDTQRRQLTQQQPPLSSTAKSITSPADVGVPPPESSDIEVPVRGAETVNVTINFTPKMFAMPTRSRGDEEYYRQSRYKPVSIEDSPMFWKDRGDVFYRERSWKSAADAYSESIKRDGVFLTCVMNRAACHLHMANFKRAVEDCTLALTMLSNTPASEITQERYRTVMTKIHARRGAAHCWCGDLQRGVQDLRMAAAYRDPTEDTAVEVDLQTVEALMRERGLEDRRDPTSEKLQKASTLYYQSKYHESIDIYRAVLSEHPYAVHGRSNLAAALLQAGQFSDALAECTKLIEFCSEVAQALNQPGALSGSMADSDDDDEIEEEEEEEVSLNRDEMSRQRRAAAKKVSENSGHVYLLLKAYVRGAAALCGLQEYHTAHGFLENALRITPYDNDLVDDCNRLTEKIRMDTLMSASAQVCK